MKEKTNQKPIYNRNYFKRHKYGDFDSRLGYVAVFCTDYTPSLPFVCTVYSVRKIGDPTNCNAMVDGRKR